MDLNYDVLLVGGGIAGLMSAQKLSGLGLRIALIERELTLASGPSTKNEGWLHRGTYHAFSIKDRTTAIQVARRCIYGHEQLRLFAPEALEITDILPIALIKNKDSIADTISRWDEADVKYRPLSRSEASCLAPDISFNNVNGIFQVADVSINTKIFITKTTCSSSKI